MDAVLEAPKGSREYDQGSWAVSSVRRLALWLLFHNGRESHSRRDVALDLDVVAYTHLQSL